MDAIKNFIYLDEYKMYSMSAQIFGGVIHSLSSYEDITKEKDEDEETPIVKHEFGGEEHKHFHDYAYIRFEERLKESGKIISLSAENIDENITQLNDDKFVEVRGKVVLVDMNELESTIENINKVGEALNQVSTFSVVDQINKQMEKQLEASNNKNEKANIRRTGKRLIDEVRAKHPYLKLDDDYVENLRIVLDYGFRDQFVIQTTIGAYVFSAECGVDNIREKKDLLIRKLSRLPEKEFVIVGIISQSLNHNTVSDSNYQTNNVEGTQHMKAAIMSVAQQLSAVEFEFTGRQENEVIIDPIAVYWEI